MLLPSLAGEGWDGGMPYFPRALLQGKFLATGNGLGGTPPRGVPLGHPRVAVVEGAWTAIAEPVRLGYRPISRHIEIGFNGRAVWGIRAPRDFHAADAVPGS